MLHAGHRGPSPGRPDQGPVDGRLVPHSEAAILLFAVAVVALFGVKAERTALEQVAEPLSAVGADEAVAH